MFLNWALSNIFHIYSEIMNFGGKKHRGQVLFPLHYIKCTYYSHDLWLLILTLPILAKVVFFSFLHYKVTLFPHLSILYILEGSHYAQMTQKNREFWSYLQGVIPT